MTNKWKIKTEIPPYRNVVIDSDGLESYIPAQFKDVDGNHIICDIDPFSGKSFMLNENGFITNDIMAFEQSESDNIARSVLSRIKYVNSGSLPQDMSFEDAVSQVVPANYSSPAELSHYSMRVAESLYNKQVAESFKKTQETIDFTERDTTVIDSKTD